ncbi:hypothetical protein F2Q69_00002484 [Brassica cretica]|uniref:RNase H type-1 domain-containing protein n=1 Tax=Brassica cretica TaxID=69181 RepID=A0A8S9P3H4_BRACR|nr:hypothetical protein F2Q69_00002484 [Brassica cretica]
MLSARSNPSYKKKPYPSYQKYDRVRQVIAEEDVNLVLNTNQKQSIGESVRLAFPWILWQIWKARNKFCFERVIPVSSVVVSTAMDEAVLWLKLHGDLGESSITPQTDHGGASWIVRDSFGKVMFHSRRSFNDITSAVQADLMAVSWSAAAMADLKLRNIMFEFSSAGAAEALESPSLFPSSYYLCYEVFRFIHMIPRSSLQLVPVSCNSTASAIALSVTRDNRWYLCRVTPQLLQLL